MVSPLAPKHYVNLPALDGVNIVSVASGLRYRDRLDMLLTYITSDQASIAGVFTKNQFPSEPIKWCKQIFPNVPQALWVSAGNANVCTGDEGWRAQQEIIQCIGNTYGIAPEHCYLSMTGVIGELFNPAPLLAAIRDNPPVPSTSSGWQAAAEAIMTTDTFPKLADQSATLAVTPFKLFGIAKGSGMVAPNMATMLVFLFSDVQISQPLMQKALKQACDDSFNAISVDSDTSTSDTVLLISTQAAGNPTITDENSGEFEEFQEALGRLCQDLALQVVSDGEGITKRIDLHVTGAKTVEEAKVAGLSVLNSPLVKTAISGEDANWGRIIMAIGKTDVSLNPDKISVSLCNHQVCSAGGATRYNITALDQALKASIIPITIDLGVGSAQKRLWGNDLSHEYIRINADYRS